MEAAFRPTGGPLLVGEPLAVDLLNTRVQASDGPLDLLATPTDLQTWLATQADRLPQPDAPLTAADLHAVHALRDAIATAVGHARAGKRPPLRALRALVDVQRAAPLYRELDWDGAALTITTRRAGNYAQRLLAELADAASDLLASPAIANVRECQRSDCVRLFKAVHPHRRWCSPACGNRTRVARHYKRHKPR